MREETRPCKHCGNPFTKIRVTPRPIEYCSYACNYAARLKRKADQARERYGIMRQAGVEPWKARAASTAVKKFQDVMAELKEANGCAAE